MRSFSILKSMIYKWSGRWDSNPRPVAWQATALSTELHPLKIEGSLILSPKTVNTIFYHFFEGKMILFFLCGRSSFGQRGCKGRKGKVLRDRAKGPRA